MIVKCGNHEVELYDSMHDLGILRFQRFNKYQMNAIEIGSNFDDYDKRTAKTYQFLQKGMVAEAMQELNNRRMTVYAAFEEFTPTGKALAILVKRIDKRMFTDYSNSTLDIVIKRLDEIGFSYEMAITNLNAVKKKSKRNVKSIFQDLFQKARTVKKQSFVSIGLMTSLII